MRASSSHANQSAILTIAGYAWHTENAVYSGVSRADDLEISIESCNLAAALLLMQPASAQQII